MCKIRKFLWLARVSRRPIRSFRNVFLGHPWETEMHDDDTAHGASWR